MASLVATGETSEAAIRVVKTALERHGIPQRFLSDNGVAFNPTRRGKSGALVDYLKSLGVKPITGKPGKPATQGKNERFHQTLHKYLNHQPKPETISELQALVDVFDEYYNSEREHQALPLEAWNATPKATPPDPAAPRITPTADRRSVERTVYTGGIATVVGTRFQVGKNRIGQKVHVLYDETTIMFFDTNGLHIITHQRPPKGTNYVGNNEPRGFMATQMTTKS